MLLEMRISESLETLEHAFYLNMKESEKTKQYLGNEIWIVYTRGTNIQVKKLIQENETNLNTKLNKVIIERRNVKCPSVYKSSVYILEYRLGLLQYNVVRKIHKEFKCRHKRVDLNMCVFENYKHVNMMNKFIRKVIEIISK